MIRAAVDCTASIRSHRRFRRGLILLPGLLLAACATTPEGGDAGGKGGEPAARPASSKSASGGAVAPSGQVPEGAPKQGVVAEVVKGDEIVLEDGWVVRLTGIDVPTADYGKRSGDFYGKAAIQFVKDQVLGKKVTLKYDSQVQDVYDRYLAYVYLPDGTFLNEALVAKGHALAACFPPNTKHCSTFAGRQRDAVQAQAGLWDFDPADWPESDKPADTLQDVTVERVVDGDTIQLADGTVVRYIGIDAPESEAPWREGAFGHDSYALNKRLVEGQKVDLEYDTELSDPRGRELAYVYVGEGEDRTMVNAELVRRGVAWVAVFPPNVKHIRSLYEAQEEALQHGNGIWAR